ncbi:MAG TPA: general secretion pathway protein GspB [Xanthomonadales bacterium]|nr:general secretion pathway protein GspB [Xanthomonadales bacterium]
MSLIYEALRKSEEQRRLGETPTLSTPPLVHVRRRRRTGRYLALGAAVVVIGAAAWWLGRASLRDEPVVAAGPSAPIPAAEPPVAVAPTPAQSGVGGAEAPTPAPTPPPSEPSPAQARPAGATAPIATTAPAATASASTPAIPPELQRKLDSGEVFANSPEQLTPREPTREQAYVPPEAALPEPLPDLENEPPAAAPAAVAEAPVPPAPVAIAATAPAIATTPSPVVPTPAPAAEPAPAVAAAPPPASAGPAVPYLFELPLATRRDLPALKLNMHVWSEDPARRFVIVDGTRAPEGGTVSDGLIVAEIRSDGVVLEFRGQRFLLPRSGG